MRAVIVDGVERADGRIDLDVDDPGLALGMCVFETMRTYGGRVFRLEQHLERLEASAAALGAPCPSTSIAAEVGRSLAGLPQGEEANVRVTLSASGRRIVRAQTLAAVSGPARCATMLWEPHPALPGWIKHTSRAASALAVQRPGVTEVLWVDRGGLLLEGTRSNIFGVRGGQLWTPPLDGRILAGVTRAALLDAARRIGVPVREAPTPLEVEWEELYVCSTLRELQPVERLNDAPAPGAGPVGRRVIQAFYEEISPRPGSCS